MKKFFHSHSKRESVWIWGLLVFVWVYWYESLPEWMDEWMHEWMNERASERAMERDSIGWLQIEGKERRRRRIQLNWISFFSCMTWVPEFLFFVSAEVVAPLFVVVGVVVCIIWCYVLLPLYRNSSHFTHLLSLSSLPSHFLFYSSQTQIFKIPKSRNSIFHPFFSPMFFKDSLNWMD